MYVTVREAAKLTGLSQSTIRRRIAAGRAQARNASRAHVDVTNGVLVPQDQQDPQDKRLGDAIERLDRLRHLLRGNVIVDEYPPV